MHFNLDCNIPNVRNFKWSEALYLRKWQVHACPDRHAEHAIQRMALVLQMIRDAFGRPVKIHSWYRPGKYNELVGGAERSYHIKGEAVDFSVTAITSAEVHSFLEPKLEELQIRLKHEYANYVHIDCGEPGVTGRYFRI